MSTVMYVLYVMKYGCLNYAHIQVNGEIVCYMTLQSIMFNCTVDRSSDFMVFRKIYCLIYNNCNTSLKIFVTLSESFW